MGIAELYESGLSIKQLATRLGWGYETTRRRLRKAGANIRTSGQGVSLARRADPFDVAPEVRPLVDGLLLGDGSIERGGVGSRLRLNQCVKNRPWVDMVGAAFTSLGIEWREVRGASGIVEIAGQSYTRSPSYGVRTRSYTYFTQERDRWYPGGEKRVPEDVNLSPTSIAHWYFGDGMVGSKGYHAKFATDGFRAEDVNMLIALLHRSYGWSATRTARNRILLSRVADRADLHDMIKDCTPSCFQHKLCLRLVDHRLKFDPDVREKALLMRKEGVSYRNIGRTLGVSKTLVAEWCQ
jgi:transposase-like protein